MASLLDRICGRNDWDTDGGYIAAEIIGASLHQWAAGALSVANFKTMWGMTTAQGNQLDAILATRPVAPLLLLNVPAYVQWVDKVIGAWVLGAQYMPGYDTDALVRAAIGI